MYWTLCRNLIMKFKSPCWTDIYIYIYIYLYHPESRTLTLFPESHDVTRIVGFSLCCSQAEHRNHPCGRPGVCASACLLSSCTLRSLCVIWVLVKIAQSRKNRILPIICYRIILPKWKEQLIIWGKTLEIQIPMWSCIQIEYPWIKWFKTSFCPLTEP